MNYYDDLQPGKRENAFYVKSSVADIDKIGFQSLKNKEFYIYTWDPNQQMHVGKWVKREWLEDLEND